VVELGGSGASGTALDIDIFGLPRFPVLFPTRTTAIFMAPMDDQRDSSSPEMGFAGYDTYHIQGSPSDTSLPYPPPFSPHQPWYLASEVPSFEGRFSSIRRSSQSSLDDPYLRPRAPQDRANEFAEDESPDPLLMKQGILSDPMENANEFVRKLFKFVSWSGFGSLCPLTHSLGPLIILCFILRCAGAIKVTAS